MDLCLAATQSIPSTRMLMLLLDLDTGWGSWQTHYESQKKCTKLANTLPNSFMVCVLLFLCCFKDFCVLKDWPGVHSLSTNNAHISTFNSQRPPIANFHDYKQLPRWILNKHASYHRSTLKSRYKTFKKFATKWYLPTCESEQRVLSDGI